ncbi:WD40 repeat-like protein [Protomyces lactucae-debilis]|uniref:WD40 repeat-like protein n=1 Tax=Protomyces lactucae-debilis TaxID=2754530 RepID=A0A1Y2F571_PROLT|nr:WD40 repeat-like protein [Protomyces lactucae-debilis]ORY78993.1 WD40 repeat-like protein [Protomyces lactucae-debilis]
MTSILPPQPSTTRASPTKLAFDPKSGRIAYASNKSVFIRDLEDPSKCMQYVGHVHPVQVARFSPSGFYVASGDVSGLVKIWDAVGEEHILKNEVKPIQRITDLAWDGDSARIIAVGEGRERFGHAFTMDSGNTVGEITGHSGVINAVSIRQQRPFRAATAGDDGLVVFYHGTPYKYNKTLRQHTKFVLDVAFSPDGATLVSVGADAKICLYDGKTGDVIDTTWSESHTGSIFAVSWDPTSTFLLTSSADQSCKVWEAKTGKLVQSWDLRETDALNPADGQQVGNVWTPKHIVSLSLSGTLTYLSIDSETPLQRIAGHQKAITALAISPDGAQLYTGSYDATNYIWQLSDASSKRITKNAHTNQVSALIVSDSIVLSLGLDDSVRVLQTATGTFSRVLSTTSKPIGAGLVGQDMVIATSTELYLVGTGSDSKIGSISIDATAAAVSNHGYVAIGDEAGNVKLYTLDGQAFKLVQDLQACCRASITTMTWTPSADKVIVGDAAGKILVLDGTSGAVLTSRWSNHTARIQALSVSKDGKKVVSASLDASLFVWSLENFVKKKQIRHAHQGGATGCVFKDDAGTIVVSVGADGAIKQWPDMTF